MRRSQARVILLAVVCIMLMGCLSDPGQKTRSVSERRLSVCEMFRDISAYSGKKVTVHGIYYFGLRQTNCGYDVLAGGRRWPTALDMIDTRRAIGAGLSGLAFETDKSSWKRLDELVLQVGLSGEKAEIWVTVRGKLRGPTPHVLPNSGIVGGYGEMGAYPAQIIVERVEDLEVKRVPTFDYKKMLPPRDRRGK